MLLFLHIPLKNLDSKKITANFIFKVMAVILSG